MTTSAAEPHPVEHLDDAVRVVLLPPSDVLDRSRTNGLPRLIVPRMVPPRRRMPVTSLVVSDAHAVELDAARRSCPRGR